MCSPVNWYSAVINMQSGRSEGPSVPQLSVSAALTQGGCQSRPPMQEAAGIYNDLQISNERQGAIVNQRRGNRRSYPGSKSILSSPLASSLRSFLARPHSEIRPAHPAGSASRLRPGSPVRPAPAGSARPRPAGRPGAAASPARPARLASPGSGGGKQAGHRARHRFRVGAMTGSGFGWSWLHCAGSAAGLPAPHSLGHPAPDLAARLPP